MKPQMTEEEYRRVVHAIMDDMLCCKRVDARHPWNHNTQVRTQGRCYCECHGQRG